MSEDLKSANVKNIAGILKEFLGEVDTETAQPGLKEKKEQAQPEQAYQQRISEH